MHAKMFSRVTTMTLFAALAMPVCMAAQDNPSQDNKHKHHQYKLIDMGTFGGPNSYVSNPSAQDVNNRGTVQGWADTPFPDPYDPNCFDPGDCFVAHAFQWRDGVVTDLGALPGGGSSAGAWINERGVIAGVSENGLVDPLTGFPEETCVVWQKGQIVDLGTFGGNQGAAAAINNRGQIVGGALNAIPDPYSSAITESFVYFAPAATQSRAALWQNGVIQDLGTLGGNDAVAILANERGQIAGLSYTNSTPNPATGVPTQDPFLWEDGKMRDLGTLGGTFGYPTWLNNRGQVVGQSDLAGDLTAHPFLWDKGKLADLGTLGGNNGQALWVNDAGEVIGSADLPGSHTHDGFLWKHGVMTDLGTQDGDPCSVALSINSPGQITGASTSCGEYQHAFLWENGGPMVDLNTLVHPASGLRVREGDDINDLGEIAGKAVLPNGDIHAVLLIPCDEKHPGECDDYSMIEASATQTGAFTAERPATTEQDIKSPATRGDHLRNRFGRHYRMPGQAAASN